jgi:hypothetical protein
MADTQTIDITPSDIGFESILVQFAHQILDDVRVARVKSDRELLGQVASIAFYLGGKAATLTDDEARTTRDRIVARIETYLPR